MPKKKDSRDERIYFRATDRERQILERAADATGKSLTTFVLDAACREAERALVDRRLFVLDDDQWEAFTEALDRPPAEKPRLRELLDRPVVVE